MYLPLIKPDCVSEIIESNEGFILLLKQPDISLYKTLSRVIGRQFLKYCLGLSPFGIHVIIPSLCEIGNSFLSKIQLIALKLKLQVFPEEFKKFGSESVTSW